jgi:hypothetical protein
MDMQKRDNHYEILDVRKYPVIDIHVTKLENIISFYGTLQRSQAHSARSPY